MTRAHESHEPPLLEVEDLRIDVLAPPNGTRETVVDGVSVVVRRGEIVALLGESGAGKSMTTSAIMRLLPDGARASGRIALDGQDLLTLDENAMQRVRGRRIGLVFQEPGAALDPMYTAAWHVADAAKLSRGRGRREAKETARALLAQVGFPTDRLDAYPHELSGGMKQRLMIAIALAGEPELLIADEPTTALDVIAASQVRSLLRALQAARSLAMLVISHDVAMVAELAHRVVILYAGQVIEQGATQDVLRKPRHPYTRALLDCLPPDVARTRQARRAKLATIPQAEGLPQKGCRFAPRCSMAQSTCREAVPPFDVTEPHAARCFYPLDGGAT